MSAEYTTLLQSPEHKQMKPGKKPLEESFERCLDATLKAAQSPQPPTIEHAPFFDSLDLVNQDMLDDITNAAPLVHSIINNKNTDLESRYTASSGKNKNAPPSPGRHCPK